MNKRIFLAVKINPEPELLKLFDIIQEELADEKIKWVDENHFHITLKFFGEMPESRLEEISSAIKNCCSQANSFSFELSNPWYFRDRDQLRVVLLQTLKTNSMMIFQKLLENAFAEIGIQKEDRVFKPHLTLGRIKSIRDIRYFYELMKQFPQKTVLEVPVNEVILYESILKPSGPDYLVLERFSLTKK